MAVMTFPKEAGIGRPAGPPKYEAEACYEILTATNERQAGNPLFPSPLQAVGTSASSDRECRGCHGAQDHDPRNRPRFP